MNNVINFADYANLMNERGAQNLAAVADVVAFEPPRRTDREAELAMLLRLSAALLRAEALNDAAEIYEARDDLEVMVLHTEFPDIRHRALEALRAAGR
ncbi:hypothetical protein J2767_000161 [Agrobacterium tumefaciens]|uniref:hypothetical protein n=1 Tax=Agrobacterium tumefaciens TaxID=358 RepID=UPI000DD9E2A3|nr:hypothetical protein [Agrobacterium tumefaciens]MBP2569017.1 hypothetical protein [Agrobacterium tumefaciens]